METSRIRIKVNSQVSSRISRVTKANRDKVEIRIKMVEHRVRTVKVIRDSRIREVSLGVNKILAKIRMEDKPADRNLRIIRMVIRLDKEMPITLRMDKDNNSLGMINCSNSKEVNKDKCLICLELETKWDSKVNLVKVLILKEMVDNKVNKTVVVHQVKDRIKLEMEIHKARVLEVIILMAIMMERKLLKML